MGLQKNLMGKGKRKKIKDGDANSPPIYKWSKERKR